MEARNRVFTKDGLIRGVRKVDMTVLEALETRAPDWRLWEWRENESARSPITPYCGLDTVPGSEATEMCN